MKSDCEINLRACSSAYITLIRILGPNKFFEMRDFKAKPGRDSGLKVFTGGWIPQIIKKNR